MENCVHEDEWSITCAVKDPKQLFWPTFNTLNGIVDVDRLGPVEEPDDALERRSLGEPLGCIHPQAAADLVIASIPKGGPVRHHVVGDLGPVDLPGHVHVVRVEAGGQTHQRLLPLFLFLFRALVRGRRE